MKLAFADYYINVSSYLMSAIVSSVNVNWNVSCLLIPSPHLLYPSVCGLTLVKKLNTEMKLYHSIFINFTSTSSKLVS